MHNINRMNSLPHNQQGATLLVALILLVLISLIGVSTLKSASVVEKMSANDYQKNITFRASESAVDVTLQDQDLISEVIREGIPVTVENVDIDMGLDNAAAEVVYTSVGFGPVEGASIGANGISGQRIMITSTGSLEGNAGTQTRTVHGIVQLVPGI